MQEKFLNKKQSNLVFGFSLAIIALCVLFIVSSLGAELAYNSASSKVYPTLASERFSYYNNVLTLVASAASRRKDNSQYLAKEADYFFKAVEEGLGPILHLDESKIENLYRRAIQLNPLNYQYHLKLGWFYAQTKKTQAAEEELIKATELYPTDAQAYLYLGKFYLKNKREWLGFKNLLIAFYHSVEHWQIFDEAQTDMIGLSQVSSDRAGHFMRYIFYPLRSTFDFKEEGFPPLTIALNIRVYMKDSPEEVALLYRAIHYQNFKKIESSEGYNVYEFLLNTFPPKTDLSNFSIGTKPSSLMEKVEITYAF
ncbi:MAG: hypothetical protein PHQ96_01340 [Candidatus Omnitrophica bacterium]|nr:hypothetical protein [Candidatus Omnitrophota bacterium]